MGREPNSAEIMDPQPSQMTPPESSLAVASRPMPPSMHPEMSPMVSTAVTRNMMMMDRMAFSSKVGFTGRILGTAIQPDSPMRLQLTTQDLVYSTMAPSTSLTAVVGRMKPITVHRMYPAMIPNRMQEVLVSPLVKCLRITIMTSTTSPTNRFSSDPKSLLALPPAKELTPTLIRLRPMDSTTVPVTTGGKNFRRGLMKKPSTASHRPPTRLAPRMALYPAMPPMEPATPRITPKKPELVPMMTGTCPPTGPMDHSWIRVMTPAASMAFWSRVT